MQYVMNFLQLKPKEVPVSEQARDFQLPWQFVNVRIQFQFYLINIIASPPPGQYPMRSDFDIGKPGGSSTSTKKGIYTFGAAHEVYKNVYIPENPQQKNPGLLPGPGHYKNKFLTIGTEGINYKI